MIKVEKGQEDPTGVRMYEAADNDAQHKRALARSRAKKRINDKHSGMSQNYRDKELAKWEAKYDQFDAGNNKRKESQGVHVYGSAGTQNAHRKGKAPKVQYEEGHHQAKKERRQRQGAWQNNTMESRRVMRMAIDSKKKYHKDAKGQTHSYFEQEDMPFIHELRDSFQDSRKNYTDWDPSDIYKKHGVDTSKFTYGAPGHPGHKDYQSGNYANAHK